MPWFPHVPQAPMCVAGVGGWFHLLQRPSPLCLAVLSDGVGYSFTAVKKDGCDSSRVKSTIREFVPEAKTLSDVGREISFQLPLGAASSFPGMMGHLDEQLEALQLESYGLGVTTMEEVFIKVAQHGDRGFHENRQSKRLSTRSREYFVCNWWHHPLVLLPHPTIGSVCDSTTHPAASRCSPERRRDGECGAWKQHEARPCT